MGLPGAAAATAAAGGAVASIVAAASGGDGGPAVTDWIQLINLPLSLLILYGFARGWFITGKEHQRVVDERNLEREERIKAQAALTEKALPTLQQTEHTMGELVKAVERLDTRRRGSS